MKLVQLVNSKDALQRLIEKELPVKMAYRLSKFVKAANKELEFFEEQRVKLAKKYGKDDGKGQIIVTAENIPAFSEELDPLLNEDVDLEPLEMSLSELGNIDITTRDIIILSYLFKDE